MKDVVRIEKEVRYDTEEGTWEGKVVVYLRADGEQHLHRYFRNKNEQLLNEKLTKYWGDFYTDGLNCFRKKEKSNIFADYFVAKQWTENEEKKVVDEINKIVNENLARIGWEFKQVSKYDIDEEHGLLKECKD